MHVLFDNVDLRSRTGPNTFARRLSLALMQQGHIVEQVASPDTDLSLVFIEPSGQPLQGPVIQRLDGVWMSPSDIDQGLNDRIHALYRNAAHVVWQSEFDRKFTAKLFGVRNGTVIKNGTRVEPIMQFSVTDFEKIRRDTEHVYVASSNWHPQKRLRQIVELYEHLKSITGGTSRLLVLGANPDHVVKAPDISYLGSLDERLCAEVYSMSDWMLHLEPCGHSPNVVVECLAQETPVICSELGGTRELVGGFGLTLKESFEFNFEPFDYNNPPDIDVTQITSLPDVASLDAHAGIDITDVAKAYIEVFRRVLDT